MSGPENPQGFDANAHRKASLEGWEDAAAGWRRHQERVSAFGEPVSAWMLDAVALKPGERVLELAAGMGETGMLAAKLIAPAGGVIISDQAEAMLAGARERAAQLGLSNIEFKALNAEWIDLPVASVDAVLCRWGYMLMADPAAALSDTRRVLRPGGRLALAVWDSIERNPWALEPALELHERGLGPAPGEPAGRPGPFALGDETRVRELLEQAGFGDVQVRPLDLQRLHPGYEDLWEMTLDLSRVFHDTVMERPASEVQEIKSGLERRFARYACADGSLAIPARTLMASASA